MGTPNSLLSKLEKDLLDIPWEAVHEGMAVKLLQHDGELYVQARGSDRQTDEKCSKCPNLSCRVRSTTE